MVKKVSLHVMSRGSAWSLVPARERMEEKPVKTLNLRTHQLGAVFNKDNPHAGRQERTHTAQGTADESDNSTGNKVYLGTYVYGALMLIGLLVHEQLEGLRRRNRRVIQLGSWNILQQMIQFTREWMVMENLQLGVLMIGVALCVPTETSPGLYAKQTIYRTLILSALACLWIHHQLRDSTRWIQSQGMALRQWSWIPF